MVEDYNSETAIKARLVYNIALILLIGFLGYLTRNAWVLLGLLFTKQTTSK